MVHLDDPGVVDATQQQRFSPKVAHEILARHRRQQNLHREDRTLLALPSRGTVRARPRVFEAHRLEYSRVAPLVHAILKFQADLCERVVGKGIGSAERRDERDDGEGYAKMSTPAAPLSLPASVISSISPTLCRFSVTVARVALT